ncbi:MAG: tripartite tricarboxylate transporter substrate binding protein [Bacillota bacterium]
MRRSAIRLRTVILWTLAVLAVTAAPVLAAYPERPITYVIAFNPGGESDITARIQEPVLEKVMGVDVVVTYKIGGGGSVAWAETVRTRPDGYTIVGHNLPHIILQPLQRGDAGYKTEQLQTVYWFESTPNVLAVRTDSQFKTLQDLIDYAREHPEVVTVGGSGSNTANHLGTLALNKLAKVKTTYIPFTGTGAAVPALLGGHVTALMTYTPVAVQYKDRFRILAVASDQRVSWLPDVPTFRELGYDIVEGAYRGVAVPPGTPKEVIKALEDAFDKVMRDPKVVEQMDRLGFKIEYMKSEEGTRFVQERTEFYKSLLGELGLLQ